MNFFIVDDSIAVRTMLQEIIHSEGLGTIVGKAQDGIEVTSKLLIEKKVDILLIDFLMKKRDGLETIQAITPHYKGKIILISQVDQKDTVAEAYSLGIDHYITKPINKFEIVTVIQKVTKNFLQEKSIEGFRDYFDSLIRPNFETTIENIPPIKAVSIDEKKFESSYQDNSEIINKATTILMELGIIGETGCYDLLNIISYLHDVEKGKEENFQFPSMKDLFYKVALTNCKSNNGKINITKEAKATEQRVRRSIQHVLNNLASIGLTDFGNPTFDRYASKLFDFTQIRMKMIELEGKKPCTNPCRLNIRKFIEVLYREVKEPI